MALFFADQVRAVVLGLIAAVLPDHEPHRRHHEESEDHHRGGHREIEEDEKRIDAEHHENREIFVEVLYGDGAPRAHQDMTAVLQEGVHRNDEKASANADEHHDERRHENGPGKFESEKVEPACGSQVLREISREGDERPHADPHRQNGERALQGNLGGGKHGADRNPEAHHGLHDGSLREVHPERVVAPLENEKLQDGARTPEKRRDGKRNLSESVVPEEAAA